MRLSAALLLVACRPPATTQPSSTARASEVAPEPNVETAPPSRPGSDPSSDMHHCVPSFVEAMHRPLHRGWADGFLRRLGALPPDDPLNDPTLWTRVEIVLSRDGDIVSATTVRRSGSTAFDGAALEVVLAAGPFPVAPSNLLSGDGKVYLHWAFHRDQRECGAFGATPFVLEPPDGVEARRTPAPADEATGRVANEWLHYVHAGKIDDAVARSAIPFSIGEQTVALTTSELAIALQGIRASMSVRPKAVRIFSPTELCRKLGGLPSGVDASTPLTPVVTKVGEEYLVLLLELDATTWHVRGVARVPRPHRAGW